MKKMNKWLIVTLFLLLASIATHAQRVPPNETRIMVNKYGDTMLIMHVSDAKKMLADVLDKPIADSIIKYYEIKDGQSKEQIILYKSQINALQQKSLLKDQQINNLEAIIKNKDVEIEIKDGIIKKHKKELRKQVFLKKLAIVGAVILPITVLLLK